MTVFEFAPYALTATVSFMVGAVTYWHAGYREGRESALRSVDERARKAGR